MRKYIIVLIILLVLAACSDGSGSNKSGENTKNDKEQEKVTITFMSWGGGGQRTAEEASVKKFNETHPNIQVKAEFVPGGEYMTKFNTLLAAGNPPDVAYLYEPMVINFGEAGTTIDLTPYFQRDRDLPQAAQISDFVPGSLFENQGKIYGIGLGPEIFILYYNKQLFKDAGIEPPSSDPKNPWTWQQLLEAARKLTVDAKGKHPTEPGFNPKKVKTYGLAIDAWSSPVEALLKSNEGGFVNEDGTKSLINSDASIEVLQSISDLWNKEHVSPTPEDQKALPGKEVMMQNNQLAMHFTGQWATATYGDNGYDVGFAAIPMFKKPVNIIWSAGISIFENSKHKDAAWEFVKFISNPNENLEMYSGGTWIAPMKSWYTDESLLKKWTDNDRKRGNYVNVVKDTVLSDIATLPYVITLKNAEKVNQMHGAKLEEIWQGKPAAEVLKNFDKEVQKELTGNY